MRMPLLHIIGVLLLAGLLVWVINALPFIAAPYKRVASIVVAVVIALWLIALLFGVDLRSLGSTRVGR